MIVVGGVRVTRALGRADVHVTVVDRANHHLFQPLLSHQRWNAYAETTP